MSAASRFRPTTREAIVGRDLFRCVVCGDPTEQIQHRRPAMMGGSRQEWIHLPANGVLACGSGTSGCHGRMESFRMAARDCGLLLRPIEQAGSTPVWYEREEEWRFLDDAGGYLTVQLPPPPDLSRNLILGA